MKQHTGRLLWLDKEEGIVMCDSTGGTIFIYAPAETKVTEADEGKFVTFELYENVNQRMAYNLEVIP